jgi:outer membrane protein TolC/predicted transcriptional regulator
MKTISQEQFIDFMTQALPELVSSVMREDTGAVAKGDISIPQFWALHYIDQQGQLSVNQLAGELHRSKSTTSALLQRLGKSGMIKRQRDTDDQRVVHISLTAKGKRLVDRAAADRKQGIRQTYSSLTATERTQHMQLIRKIMHHAQKAALLAAVLLPSLSMAQTTNAYSLDESIRTGLKRSLTVANAAREREIAGVMRKRAFSQALPKLTGTANYTSYDSDNISGSESKGVGAAASWEIFSGGRTLSAIRASKSYRELTTYQERQVRATQVRDIALAYYEVQLAKEQVAARAQSVGQLADFEAETKKKYDAGTVSEFDWLSARVSLANERPYLITAENSLALAREGFRNLTFIDDENFELTDPLAYRPIEVNLDQAIALGLAKRPELLEMESTVELRAEDITQQKSDYYPALSLFANYDYSKPDPYAFYLGETGWKGHWNTGVQATWNLFDGGSRKSNVAESKLNLAIAEDEYRDLERYVSLDVKTAWLRGRDAAEVIEATEETVNLATRALEIARSRFDAGLGTNLEVTQANVELSDARLARSRALYEYVVAATQLKYAVGILLEEYEQ